MPPKKKTQKNPFYFFMMDWKKEQEEMGRRVPGPLNLLAEAATEDWKSLPETQKAFYKEKARAAKEEDKMNLHNKFTAEGKSYAQLYSEKEEIENFQKNMKEEIKETIASISQNKKCLLRQRFYLIHANHYCYWSAKNTFIPCEVAVAEYSLEHGVMSTYHCFPAVFETDGKLPVGYLHEAQEIAKRTHLVPLPPCPWAKDYGTISQELVSFLMRHETSAMLPPLYTLEDNVNCNNFMTTVKDFLKNCEFFCDHQFRVYNLDWLFFVLKNACADFSVREGIDREAMGFPALSIAQMQLERDIFHFTKGISCEYHEELSVRDEEIAVTQYCSKSTVQRWAFLISDYCCKDVGVQLQLGKHCPRTADLSSPSESSGRALPGTSTKFVDAPPPAVNCWSKGPPQARRPGSSDPSNAATNGLTGHLPEGVRLPKTKGRGERLVAAMAAINRMQLEGFPPLE